MASVKPGLLVVDKTRGPTSHDVVMTLRHVLGTRHVGHAGTLDPMATGVLVLSVGEATKLVPYLTDATKEYEARIQLGQETNTLDALGTVVAEDALDDALLDTLDRLDAALAPRIADAVAAELARTSQDPPPSRPSSRRASARTHERAGARPSSCRRGRSASTS